MPKPLLSAPDPAMRHPLPAHPRVVFLKAVVKAENVEIGDYTYYDDPIEPHRFYEKCVLHHFPVIGDRLVIGRYTAIATGVQFIMNGANHALCRFSTFPFQIFGGTWTDAINPAVLAEPPRGDTVIGNDVWIGHEATILPGRRVGDGAIIAAKAVVSRDVPPYAVAAGNPARVVKMRFPDEIVARLIRISWWDWPVEKVTRHLAAITGADIATLEEAVGEAAP